MAFAEVVRAEPTAFTVKHAADVQANSDRAWSALAQVQRWWHSAHTYSRDSGRLELELRANACFCERWAGGSVEHARVILAMVEEDERMLRLEGGLGPLQELGVDAVLTWTLTPGENGGTHVELEYVVNGDTELGLDQAAGDVDFVIGQQLARYARFLDTGSPEPQIASAED